MQRVKIFKMKLEDKGRKESVRNEEIMETR